MEGDKKNNREPREVITGAKQHNTPDKEEPIIRQERTRGEKETQKMKINVRIERRVERRIERRIERRVTVEVNTRKQNKSRRTTQRIQTN